MYSLNKFFHIIRPNRVNTRNIIKNINENDITHEKKNNIANVCNSYFVNIGKNISESMNAGHYDHNHYLNKYQQIYIC